MTKSERKAEHKVRTLDKRIQVARNWCGAMDIMDGVLEVGCDEEHTATILWHEFIHKLLFEQYCLEGTIMWDNIADDIQVYLFDIGIQDQPYIFKSPPAKSKEIDDGAWRSENQVNGAGKRKQSEKSVVTGWKKDPKYDRKVPVTVPWKQGKNVLI